MNINDIHNRNSRVIELTSQQFFDGDAEEIGFNGKTWARDIQAIIVDGTTVYDKKHAISRKGIRLFNHWLRVKFGYKL